jgi:rare lipoprotein A
MTRALLRPVFLLAALLASGCQRREHPPAPALAAHYVVGPSWQGRDGAWFYPSEQTNYRATGLAVVENRTAGSEMADGEPYDPAAVTASLQTLQLPSIVRVTDLENGRSLLVRAIGRGPDDPGRLIALSPRAASLLGIVQGTAAQVSVTLESDASQTLSSHIQGAPSLDIQAAPVGGVQEQTLGPPGSPAANLATPAPARRQTDIDPPTMISTSVRQDPAMPGQLWIDLGRFSSAVYARQAAARSGGTVTQEGYGREAVYRALVGPFRSVNEADAALDQARHAGVTGARIIVE